MSNGPILLAAVILAGCGAPALVTASQQIAELRGCQPANLTVSGPAGALAVDGCGPRGAYDCAGGQCSESDAAPQPDTDRVALASEQLSGLEAGIAECAEGGETPAVQVYIDADGTPDGLAVHPDLGSEVRSCIGRLVLREIGVSSGGELLVSNRSGATPAEDVEVVLTTPDETMDTVEPVEALPPEEPVEDGAVNPSTSGEPIVNPATEEEAAPEDEVAP